MIKALCRHTNILNALAIRRRHMNINLMTSVQHYVALNPAIRAHCSGLILFELRALMRLTNTVRRHGRSF